MKLISKFLSLLVVFTFTLTLASAQSTSFRARLSEMPVTPQTVNTITGVGEVFVTLNGSTVSVSGSFEGMSSAASAVHIHNAPKAMNGPPIGALEVTAMPNGQVSGELELTADQITALRNEELYIVIHSETNPGGELRGWLFARD
jgi:Cu/Zn superoxide dismutase